MCRLFILVPIVGLAMTLAEAQAPTEPQKSPREAVEQFYKLETQGRWLGPEHWDELQNIQIRLEPWSAPESISVVKTYQVVDCEKDGRCGRDQVEVDFYEWGSINPFLNFVAARDSKGNKSANGEPVEQRTYQTLYFSDSFVSESGDEEKKGSLRWRSTVSLTLPRLNVDTALRWVAEMRDKSNDPAIRYNAEKTIAILNSLVGGILPSTPPKSVGESPEEIARRFVSLESSSLPEQWSALTDYFVETPRPRWDNVHIVDILNIGAEEGPTEREVEVSTNSLGTLDASMRLRNYPPGRLLPSNSSANACYGDDRFGFTLLLSEKRWEIAKNGLVKELDSPLAWRVEDTSFVPLITLDAAMRYVRQVANKTADPVVKRNAARTLRILDYFSQGKLLPKELSSGASGGCG